MGSGKAGSPIRFESSPELDEPAFSDDEIASVVEEGSDDDTKPVVSEIDLVLDYESETKPVVSQQWVLVSSDDESEGE